MNEEIKEIMNKFNNILKSYEMDKKFGQLSIESICHLFPNEVIIIKDCITNLQEENERLRTAFNGSEKTRKKAIEYIKKSINYYYDEDLEECIYQDEVSGNDLLKILGGD